MTDTAYDRAVQAGREIYRKEAQARERAERAERCRGQHKAAARIWFNLVEEVWPPENTEAYWDKVMLRFSEVWNENSDNILLQHLLLMTPEYLNAVARNEE